MIKSYPNPVIDKKFRISFNSSWSNDVSIRILDLTGKVIYTQKIEKLTNRSIAIDLSQKNNMNKGIFTLSITSKEGYVNRKIVLF